MPYLQRLPPAESGEAVVCAGGELGAVVEGFGAAGGFHVLVADDVRGAVVPSFVAVSSRAAVERAASLAGVGCEWAGGSCVIGGSSDVTAVVPSFDGATGGEWGKAVSVREMGDVVIIRGPAVQVAGVLRTVREVGRVFGPRYFVRLTVISAARSVVERLGLDVVPAASVGYGVDLAGSSGWSGTARLGAALSAEGRRSGVRVESLPQFFCSAGRPVTVSRSQAFPVPRRVVSVSGVVETQGFDTISAVQSFRVLVRPVDYGRLIRLDLECKLGEVVGQADGLPVTSEESLVSVCDVRPGGTHLLGSVVRRAEAKNYASWLSLAAGGSVEERVWQVWATVDEVR